MRSVEDRTPLLSPISLGGADLLATGTQQRFHLPTLAGYSNGNLSVSSFAGWSTNNPTGLTVIGMTPSQRRLEKWSQGTADGYALPLVSPVNGTGSHIQVTWSQVSPSWE